MDLLSHLRALAGPDLDAVLANRPESAGLRGRARSRLAELAASLGQAHGVQMAVGRLNRFHLQLLQLACVFGGRLDRATAADQGVPPDALEPAARALARTGLAFPEEGGLDVPPEVQAAISYRRSLGAPLLPLLQAETAEDLKRVAHALGAPIGRKADLVDGIASRLNDPGWVRSLLGQAPPESRHALDVIRGVGVEAPIHDLAGELGPDVHRFRYGLGGRGEKDGTGLAWLWRRGLIFRDRWESTVVVPAPVEVAIRGRAFATWETGPPELELAPVAFDRGPLTLIEEMSRLVRSLAQAEMPLLKSAQIGLRECRRVASELGMDEQSMRWLLDVGWRAGLLGLRTQTLRPQRRRQRWAPPDEDHFLVVTDGGRRWLTAEPAEAWLTVFKAWLRGVDEALLASTLTPAGGREILRAIVELPPSQGATPATLGRRLSWLMPAAWQDDESATAAVVDMRSALTALGVIPTSGALAVSELGRAALAGRGVSAIRKLLPSGVEGCTVQADLTVIVAGPPSVELGAGLARFAELQSSSAARVYRLTERSVCRGLDQGVTAGEIETFLVARSGGELPGPVRELIRDLGRRHGRLRVGTAAVYIVGEDAAVLAEALVSARLRALGPRLLAPTVAVVDGKTQAQVAEALRKSGLMPVVEQAVAEPAPPVEEPAPAPARRRRESLTDPEVLERRRQALQLAREARRQKMSGQA